MNETQRAAFIIAQAALLNAEIAAMQAANEDYRSRTGNGVAYNEAAFHGVISRYSCLESNAAWGFLLG